jgi:RNA recognition motif-containing protein
VIRDYKTNDSLQYAFIEFEKEDDCIMAYSKMDGVLVDERRIKVDFSNSVAKLWNQHRRNKLRDEARDIMQDEQKNKDTIYKMNPFA